MLRLDDLLAPLGARAFFAEHAGRAPVHLAGAPPAWALPGWPELAELLNMSALWSADTLKLLKAGQLLPPEEYCEPATDRDLLPVQRPIADRVLVALDGGAALIARQIETLSPALKTIAAGLETGFGARVTADLQIWRSPGAQAPAERALTDLYVLQLAGSARLQIHDGLVENPLAHPRFADAPTGGARVLDAVLQPGDRVYVPRGRLYGLEALTGDCGATVFNIIRPVGLDLIQALIESAIEDPFFRAALPAPSDAAQQAAYLADFARRLGALAASDAGAAAASRLERGFQRDLSDFQLPAAGGSAADTNRCYRRTASQLEVIETPNGWLLRSARGAVPIPAGRERQVAWIAARQEFTRTELLLAFPDAGPDLLDPLLRDLAAMRVIALRP